MAARNTLDIAAAIRAVVIGEFQLAAGSFYENPTTEAWARLYNAMWARQAVTYETLMMQAVPKLEGIGVSHWIETLRELHEGKTK